MAKHKLTPEQQKVLESAGFDVGKMDWAAIIAALVKLLPAILALFAQPKPTMATAAGCAPEDVGTASCMIDCAMQNLSIAQCLIEHAAECCPTPPAP